MRKEVRILIVDDQPGYFELIQEHAEMNDHIFNIECAHADSESGALDKIRDFEPTVILVDAHIQGMNCFDLVRKCRDGLAQIIVTSDSCSHEIEMSARTSGAVAYVIKDVQPEHIESMLSEIAEAAPATQITH